MPHNSKREQHNESEAVQPESASLREHLRAHKAVLYLRHLFIYFINSSHGFHTQIVNVIKES